MERSRSSGMERHSPTVPQLKSSPGLRGLLARSLGFRACGDSANVAGFPSGPRPPAGERRQPRESAQQLTDLGNLLDIRGISGLQVSEMIVKIGEPSLRHHIGFARMLQPCIRQPQCGVGARWVLPSLRDLPTSTSFKGLQEQKS